MHTTVTFKMRLFIYIVLMVPACDARVSTTGRKLTKLQQDVDFLRNQAIDLMSDIEELFAWRNASEFGLQLTPDDGNRAVLGFIEMNYKSIRVVESRIEYIIKGLSDEKMMLREIVSDATSEVREGMNAMQRMVEEVAAETRKVRTIAERNEDAHLALFVNLTSKIDTLEKGTASEIAGIKSEGIEYMKQMNETTLAVEDVDSKVNTLKQNVIALEDMNVTVNTLSQEMVVVGVLEGKVNTMEQGMVLAEDVDNKVNTLKQELVAADGKILAKLNAVLKIIEHKDWIFHRNSFYKLFPASKKHADATQNCEEHGAGLVEVNDAEEMQFLAEKFGTGVSFWIAGTDVGTEGSWRLPSGRLMTYQNWNRYEPNNSGSNEDCIHAGGDLGTKWNDLPCSSECRYICEI